MSKENTDLLYSIIYDFLDQNNITVIELAVLFKKIEMEQLQGCLEEEDGEE